MSTHFPSVSRITDRLPVFSVLRPLHSLNLMDHSRGVVQPLLEPSVWPVTWKLLGDRPNQTRPDQGLDQVDSSEYALGNFLTLLLLLPIETVMHRVFWQCRTTQSSKSNVFLLSLDYKPGLDLCVSKPLAIAAICLSHPLCPGPCSPCQGQI